MKGASSPAQSVIPAHSRASKNRFGGTYSVLAYRCDPPPTPAPDSTITSSRYSIRWMPYISISGCHRKWVRFQFVFGMSSSFHRLPDSITPTR